MDTDEKDLDALDDAQETRPAEIAVHVDREFGVYVEGAE